MYVLGPSQPASPNHVVSTRAGILLYSTTCAVGGMCVCVCVCMCVLHRNAHTHANKVPQTCPTTRPSLCICMHARIPHKHANACTQEPQT